MRGAASSARRSLPAGRAGWRRSRIVHGCCQLPMGGSRGLYGDELPRLGRDGNCRGLTLSQGRTRGLSCDERVSNRGESASPSGPSGLMARELSKMTRLKIVFVGWVTGWRHFATPLRRQSPWQWPGNVRVVMWRRKFLRHRGQRPCLSDPFMTGRRWTFCCSRARSPLFVFERQPGPSHLLQAADACVVAEVA